MYSKKIIDTFNVQANEFGEFPREFTQSSAAKPIATTDAIYNLFKRELADKEKESYKV